jgi:chemotaxis protein MotB
MGQIEKQIEPEAEPGAPEWMVTFSDCMTLLLTFFVLLLSFSSFDDKVFLQMHNTVFEDLPQIYQQVRRSRDAVTNVEQINPAEDPESGSEKPNYDNKSIRSSMKEREPKEFHDKKVFIGDSDRFFWGNGTVISSRGREILTTLGAFLHRVSGRVVIIEHAPKGGKTSDQLGLTRAWAVLEYLTREQGFDKSRFSISAASTLQEADSDNRQPTRHLASDKRKLEIVILERSICN